MTQSVCVVFAQFMKSILCVNYIYSVILFPHIARLKNQRLFINEWVYCKAVIATSLHTLCQYVYVNILIRLLHLYGSMSIGWLPVFTRFNFECI